MSIASKTLLGVGIGMAYLGVTGGNLNPMDAEAIRRDEATIDQLTEERIHDRYQSVDNFGRFALQFLQNPRQREEVRVGTMEGGDSLWGLGHRVLWGRMITPEFGDDCLYRSGWDVVNSPASPETTGPAHFHGNGSDVTIESGIPGQETLRFTVDENGVLNPVDQDTIDALTQHGCERWYDAPDILPNDPEAGHL